MHSRQLRLRFTRTQILENLLQGGYFEFHQELFSRTLTAVQGGGTQTVL